MTELARSPRRIEHVRENSDKLFHDMFANCGNGSQKMARDDSGFHVPWKDRKLPPSFFQPPPPADSTDSHGLIQSTQFSGISHAYSRSTPAINFAPSRSVYSRSTQPAMNLWGPSTLPAPNSNSPFSSHSGEYIAVNGTKEIHSLPVANIDSYNMQNAAYIPGQYEQRSNVYQPQPSYSHINHGRQASLPYSHPRMGAVNHHHRFGSSLKQQQSKPTSDYWSQQQPSPQQQYPPPNVSISNPSAALGPACQHWPSNPMGQAWPQNQDGSQDASIFSAPAPANRSMPVNHYPPNDWPREQAEDSWPNNGMQPNVVVEQQQPVVEREIVDEQKQQLIFFAKKLQDERDKMKAKIEEIERKLEDVMAALNVNNNPIENVNGYYDGNADDLVPSLQIEQNSNAVPPNQLQNGPAAANWM